MFRNYLAAALRNLVRNRLYAAINIVGLTVGFAAALLIALFVRDEFSYDSYFPDHERIYLVRSVLTNAGRASEYSDAAPYQFSKLLTLDFPSIEKTARFVPHIVNIRRGDVHHTEHILWADREMLDILKLRSVAGDLTTALAGANSVVLTRAMARKYFGRDNVVGETIEIEAQPYGKDILSVSAVVEDLPSNVNRGFTFIAAGHSAASRLAELDSRPPGEYWGGFAYVYLRFPDEAAARKVEQALPNFVKRHNVSAGEGSDYRFYLISLNNLHFAPEFNSEGWAKEWITTRGDKETILAVSVIALLIVVAASINFVNLMTARATRRAVEVGVRKVTGAQRRQLVVQFVGEAVIYVFLGGAFALALAALLLPALNQFLDRTIAFDILRDIRSLAFSVGLVVMVGVLAGLYPAFVLSSHSPAAVLKAGLLQVQVSVRMRQFLIILQFAILIGLLVVTAVIGRQIQFATTEAQRLDADEVVTISNTCLSAAFKNAVAALPGVRDAVCASRYAIGLNERLIRAFSVDGESALISAASLDPGFLEFMGLNPLAGQFFRADHVIDGPPMPSDIGPRGRAVVLNETGVRKLGFGTPSAAVGKTMTLEVYDGTLERKPFEIIGVAPDYALDAVRAPVPPKVYYVHAGAYGWQRSDGTLEGDGVLSVRLDGTRIPETLEGIDGLWKRHGHPGPINRAFLDQAIQARYTDIIHQGTLFAAFTSVAIVIALLGLFGMAAFTAEQRTKEIGIRKAMGATRADILRLLLWQFTKPVLWANVIAWPVAYVVMRRWLEGFAYHTDLAPWMFLAASALAVAIALATVIGHALLVARAQPAAALRYE